MPFSQERHKFIDDYLTTFTERDTSHAEHIADSIAKPDTPLAQTLVLIPVAAHQEASQIKNSLRLYANQQTSEPFTVILSLNSPTREANNPAIGETLAALRASQAEHPELDVRSALTFYDDPIIGAIRRDLWNGALLQAYREGAYTPDYQPEYIGINHDIDTISMSSHYIARIQKYYSTAQRRHTRSHLPPVPLPTRSTLIKHASSPNHPNISRGIYWSDFTARYSGIAYEEGLVIPLSHYADHRGFPATSRTHETQRLWKTHSRHHKIPGTAMETSPRRYIERLRNGYHTIWTSETFGANDTCRTNEQHEDITPQTLEVIIENKEFIPTIAAMSHHAIEAVLWDHLSLHHLTNEEIARVVFVEANAALNRRVKLAAHILERIVQSPRLARQATDLLTDDTVITPILAAHFDVNIN